MTVLENSVVISRPMGEVFDYLSDLRNELEWNPKVEIMEKITDGPVGLGTKFRAKWTKSKVVSAECVRYERPSSWEYLNSGPVIVRVSISLTPQPGETKLTSRFDARPVGAFKLAFPVFIRLMNTEEKQNMGLLKRALEARESPNNAV